MAKKVKKVAVPKAGRKKKKSKLALQFIFIIIVFIIMSLLFLPTTFVVFFGMMPTWALFSMDGSKNKLKTVAVGAMNLAGCTYVLTDLWVTSHTLPYAISLLLKPSSMIAIYLMAMAGFVLQRVILGVVSSMMLQQARAKIKIILRRQDELKAKWGPEVTGTIPLDMDGFPLKDVPDQPAVASTPAA